MLDRSSSHTFREQFPVKLYALLALADLPGVGCSGACEWLPHGRAFRIRDEAAFMAAAVPMFFRQTKFRSFCRQLNLWGYRRVVSGADAGAWYHAHFLRGRPDEMRRMVRVKIKGTKKKGADGSSGRRRFADPDFYSMPPLPPPGPESEGSIVASALLGCGDTGGILPLVAGGANTDPSAGPGLQRRVTLERADSADCAFRLRDRNTHRNDGAFGRRDPRQPGSPRSIVPPTLPSPRGCDGPLIPYLGPDQTMGGLRRAMGDIPPSRSSPLARRSKTATEAPSYDEMAKIKQRLVAGVMPLPFGDTRRPATVPTPPPVPPVPMPMPAAASPIDVGAFSSEDQVKRALTAGLEPLPFESDPEPDEFASYIDNVIQMV